MILRQVILHRKGHLQGGLFSLLLAAANCGPAPTPESAVPAGPNPAEAPIPNSLHIYDELDYLVGDHTFPIVGRLAYLPGPGDSAYAMLALSLPNRALRFRSAAPGFLARYRVVAVVGDSLAPIAKLDEEEEVRVRSFRETSRRDESIVFQGIMTLPPGQYPAVIEMRDLSSARGFETRVDLMVPRFDPPFVTAPIAVYQAEIREDRASPPAVIVNPRATVPLSGSPLLYAESQPAGPLMLEVYERSQLVLSDTFPAPEVSHAREEGGAARHHD